MVSVLDNLEDKKDVLKRQEFSWIVNPTILINIRVVGCQRLKVSAGKKILKILLFLPTSLKSINFPHFYFRLYHPNPKKVSFLYMFKQPPSLAIFDYGS